MVRRGVFENSYKETARLKRITTFGGEAEHDL